MTSGSLRTMGSVPVLILTLTLLMPFGQTLTWMTDYNLNFHFDCNSTEKSLTTLTSIHDNHHEDRVWNVSCSKMNQTVELTQCEWSVATNDPDGLMEYQCPNNDVITGLSSEWHQRQHDRVFRFRCCKPGLLVTHSCVYTDYINNYDGPLNYTVPDNWYLRGVLSVHSNRHEDRIFRFDICKLDMLASPGEVPIVG
ncbi:hemagglutinin/amebocyte aggregation factor [Aplysia californica]|uniref:Hemagglutinin/amebocyte aggregation factor n=1 Tax=Aplysia californica TaxID=6500 RepID=A0ABM0JRF6_APLCA|nr:hemagglutinin/amebocyte aggregation factor [Aplysia californica]